MSQKIKVKKLECLLEKKTRNYFRTVPDTTVNLSSFELSDSESRVLSLGLNFVPLEKKPL